jgi:hypothetical protein
MPAFIPVTFEVGVLLGAFGTVAAFFFRSRLWPGKRGERVGDDFTILVRATDASFELDRARHIGSRHEIAVAVTGGD